MRVSNGVISMVWMAHVYATLIIGRLTRLSTKRDAKRQRGNLTSGKVPLEKTLREIKCQLSERQRKVVAGERRGRHSHEKASLSAGTVADDDELATDFRHSG